MKLYCCIYSHLHIQPYLICFCFAHHCMAGSMESAHSSGKGLGAREAQEMRQAPSFRAEDLMPKNAKPFHSEQARQSVESNAKPSSEIVEFLTSGEVRQNERENKNFHAEELFLKNSEEIANRSIRSIQDKTVEELIYSSHTCRQAADPILISFERSLNVSVHHEPEEKAKICLGHHQTATVKKKGDFHESTSSYRKKFKGDPSIKSYKIEPLQSLRDHYMAYLTWTHVENAEGCGKCEIRTIKEAVYQELGEEWVYDNPELLALSKSPDNTLVEQVCLDHAPKTINGKQVERQCWKEKISFLHRFPRTKECDVLRDKLCEQISQACIQASPFGCAMWELTFRCLNALNRQIQSTDSEDLYGFNDYAKQEVTQPNRSFAEVATQLAIFDEAKKDLEKSQALDASRLEIFKGKKMTCSKSVVDNLLYDCCFNYTGLAKQMGLSKCSADELSLAELREQGLCHYVGSYEEKVLDLWKSRDEHVFCCFPSKLARIVQEEGREQLKIEWGKPKEPNCAGFSFDLLSKLDFTKMDLSEMFDQVPNKLPDDFQDKMHSFQDRLQEQIRKEEPALEKKKRVSEG